jgi:hypothetical protein
MQIVAEYDKSTIHGNGFGGVEVNGGMYINSGAGGEATNPSEFDIYRFTLAEFGAENPPNTPAPLVVFSDDSVPPEHERCQRNNQNNRYLGAGSAQSVAEVFDRLLHM